VLILFPDTLANNATSAVERVRQSIGATQFLHGAEAVPVTVTCAIAEAAKTDTTESILSRLEATLADAQTFGGNRTFLHDGRFAAPVAPARFCLELKLITL
jgi:PleD family two-component response regulator